MFINHLIINHLIINNRLMPFLKALLIYSLVYCLSQQYPDIWGRFRNWVSHSWTICNQCVTLVRCFFSWFDECWRFSTKWWVSELSSKHNYPARQDLKKKYMWFSSSINVLKNPSPVFGDFEALLSHWCFVCIHPLEHKDWKISLLCWY